MHREVVRDTDVAIPAESSSETIVDDTSWSEMLGPSNLLYIYKHRLFAVDQQSVNSAFLAFEVRYRQ